MDDPLESRLETTAEAVGPTDLEAGQKPRQISRLSVALREILSFILGTLVFMIAAPELGSMPRIWGVFWMFFPFAPILCICLGTRRNRSVERLGWWLHVIGIMMVIL